MADEKPGPKTSRQKGTKRIYDAHANVKPDTDREGSGFAHKPATAREQDAKGSGINNATGRSLPAKSDAKAAETVKRSQRKVHAEWTQDGEMQGVRAAETRANQPSPDNLAQTKVRPRRTRLKPLNEEHGQVNVYLLRIATRVNRCNNY